MELDITLSTVNKPELEFAGPGYFSEPRRGLIEAGPFDYRFGSSHRAQIRIAVVGTRDMIESTLKWFQRCLSPISSIQNIAGVEKEIIYPGFSTIFRSELIFSQDLSVPIEDRSFDNILGLKPYQAFDAVVQLYGSAIAEAKRSYRPDVVICAIPELIEKRFWSVRRTMSSEERQAAKQLERNLLTGQLELPIEWEPDETIEDLLTRDLRRALKAVAMKYEVPIQLIRNNTLISTRSNEDPATRAWNISVGIYYKAGGLPWRIASYGPETCFVGITFHHLRTTKRQLVFSSLAQAFSSSGEGFALKGATLEPNNEGRRTPRLNREQAYDLGKKVLTEYKNRNGMYPKRLVLHKSSRFSKDEQMGFSEALRDIPVVRMVTLAPSSLRLITHSTYPPSRGTLVTIEKSRYFLFTSGYVPDLGTYPGPHIPAPVELIVHGETSDSIINEIATEVLALGRLNWNTSDLRSSQPVTLGFARRVGGIMAEYGLASDKDPDPNYRYYM